MEILHNTPVYSLSWRTSRGAFVSYSALDVLRSLRRRGSGITFIKSSNFSKKDETLCSVPTTLCWVPLVPECFAWLCDFYWSLTALDRLYSLPTITNLGCSFSPTLFFSLPLLLILSHSISLLLSLSLSPSLKEEGQQQGWKSQIVFDRLC